MDYPRRRTRRFRRGATFIAVRPLRLGGEPVLPGEELSKDLRRYHLMSLYRRGRIAEHDDPWAIGVIAKWKAKGGDVVSPESAPELVAEADGLSVYFVGSGWYSVRDASGSELEKLRGQAGLDGWVEAHAAPEPPETVEDDPEGSGE